MTDFDGGSAENPKPTLIDEAQAKFDDAINSVPVQGGLDRARNVYAAHKADISFALFMSAAFLINRRMTKKMLIKALKGATVHIDEQSILDAIQSYDAAFLAG
ncbi:MAG: hypothetical protein JWO15_3664 [Sphingomonadales bacterium]|nr:hypothetical protein [Sphingomonadales bacterium]